MIRLVCTILACWWIPQIAAAAGNKGVPSLLRKFDHELHSRKVFKPRKIACSSCHQLELDSSGKVASIPPAAGSSTFSRPTRELCHDCHRSTEVSNKEAPRACYTCHAGIDEMQAIQPRSHDGVTWRKSHALEARTDASSCNDCHTTSQCTKCHLSRNDIQSSNHSRNFKFFHSVEARARPHSCDSCHTRSYCTNCHSGVR